ncbi:MAG: flagellin, partial [Alphaproteobacteria bacterium]|nr:flagellin [Alphaproteobacteria bacterium]
TANGRMASTQSALSQISDIASRFFAQTNALTGLDATTIDTIAASARDALRQVAGLLDSKFGDTYVFAGIYGSIQPVPNPDLINSSGMVTSITATVGQLAANGAAATIAATLTTAASNTAGTSPFDPALSQTAAVAQGLRPIVQTGPANYQPVGIVAGSNSDVTSTGTSTTGSYIRDVMRALATIGALSSSQAGVTGFGTLVDDVHASLGDAITALNGDAGVLGNRQAGMATTSQHLADTATALQAQISDAQDVDMAATLSHLAAAQTQLQSAYQLLGALRSLTLAEFLR